MKLLIGLVGENGAGKTSALDKLKSFFRANTYSVAEYRFSDILVETLALWGIEKSRANLQCLAQVMDSAFGAGTLSRSMRTKIKNAHAQIIFVDGVRWETDRELIKSLDGILIYITAPREIRFERLKNRNQKIGEGAMAWEQFLKEDSAPNEILVPHIGATADFIIHNNVSPEEFEDNLAKIYYLIAASF